MEVRATSAVPRTRRRSHGALTFRTYCCSSWRSGSPAASAAMVVSSSTSNSTRASPANYLMELRVPRTSNAPRLMVGRAVWCASTESAGPDATSTRTVSTIWWCPRGAATSPRTPASTRTARACSRPHTRSTRNPTKAPPATSASVDSARAPRTATIPSDATSKNAFAARAAVPTTAGLSARQVTPVWTMVTGPGVFRASAMRSVGGSRVATPHACRSGRDAPLSAPQPATPKRERSAATRPNPRASSAASHSSASRDAARIRAASTRLGADIRSAWPRCHSRPPVSWESAPPRAILAVALARPGARPSSIVVDPSPGSAFGPSMDPRLGSRATGQTAASVRPVFSATPSKPSVARFAMETTSVREQDHVSLNPDRCLVCAGSSLSASSVGPANGTG